ncbi:MAG: DNA polymerase III subunit delta [Armatimonadota bacterium]
MILKYTQLPKTADLPAEGTWLLVQGGEEFLKQSLVERLRAQLLDGDDGFNLDLVDVNERWDGVVDTAEQAKRDRLPTRVDKILTLAQALPFLGSGRLVIVRNVDALPNDQQKKLAAAYATVPPMNHLLLVTGDAGAGNKPAKLAADLQKIVEKQGTIYDCSALTEDDAAQWVRDNLQEWGQTIEPAALQLLISRTGTELRRLQIEVDKLSLMVGEHGRIRAQDVELMTPKLAEESVFHLADAVASRDAARAMAILRDLMEGQLESPYRIFPMVVRQFRLIWQVKVLQDAGWQPKQDPHGFPKAIAMLPEQNALGQIGGWMGSKLARPARQLSWEQLSGAYQALLECDMASKAIEGVPQQEMDIALEMLCAKLCAIPAGQRW